MRQRLDQCQSSRDICHARQRSRTLLWPAEIGWIEWWGSQCFGTRYKGLSETSIALFSALRCFKTSFTGGSQDPVPAALRSLFPFVCAVMTLVLLLSMHSVASRR
ncbi:uncharacterized protein M421DRAFT_243407 [Didymella exigua CBS 183.55]|uniref:Uncharacterized protein n=1 Tax=Didymella exigua CBS 183.55 TaxID=1150837 RepID=A0A6A5RIR6_9PLEO|nr:uncharacterized protein M421DRAFT_243407 [Didymella exigua CBS 183.55]KAF1925487.1 hypothetical protein M421DRAFT_243407 [Didymella exigua CBS 183.55]